MREDGKYEELSDSGTLFKRKVLKPLIIKKVKCLITMLHQNLMGSPMRCQKMVMLIQRNQKKENLFLSNKKNTKQVLSVGKFWRGDKFCKTKFLYSLE